MILPLPRLDGMVTNTVSTHSTETQSFIGPTSVERDGCSTNGLIHVPNPLPSLFFETPPPYTTTTILLLHLKFDLEDQFFDTSFSQTCRETFWYVLSRFPPFSEFSLNSNYEILLSQNYRVVLTFKYLR